MGGRAGGRGAPRVGPFGALALDGYGHRTVVDRGYDAIVVAGCRVMPDGTPSLALQRRTAPGGGPLAGGRRAADRVHRRDRDVSPERGPGGCGSRDDPRVAAGVAVLEERSTSTDENATFAAKVLPPGARIVVVTDTYHVFRAERVFGRAFTDVRGSGSVPRWDVRTKGALREVLAVVVYALTDRL